MEFSRKYQKKMHENESTHGPHALNNLEPKSGRKGDLPQIPSVGSRTKNGAHTQRYTLQTSHWTKMRSWEKEFAFSTKVWVLIAVCFFSGISISMRECDYLEYVITQMIPRRE